ncbi:MAG: hypothetical protein NT007_00315 [Candidatus Kapabacteria bacterium]|nr:hypothetical protein [Candidatus Kapabacteria bacterium]
MKNEVEKTKNSVIPTLTPKEFAFIREIAGISQRDFAKITGLHWNTICRWEKNRRIKFMPAKFVEFLMQSMSADMWQHCLERLKNENLPEPDNEFQELNNIYLPKFGLTLDNRQEYERFIKYVRKYRKARAYRARKYYC